MELGSANVQSKKETRTIQLVCCISQQRQNVETNAKTGQRPKRVKQSEKKEDLLDQLLINLEAIIQSNRIQREGEEHSSEEKHLYFSLETRLVSRIVVCLSKVSGKREARKAGAFYFDNLGKLLLRRNELDKENIAQSAANLLSLFVDLSWIWPDLFSLETAGSQSTKESNETVQFMLKCMRYVFAGLEGDLSAEDREVKKRYTNDLKYLSSKIGSDERDVNLDNLLDAAVAYLKGLPAHPGES